MRLIIIALMSLLIWSSKGYTQVQDSIKQKASDRVMAYARDRFEATRILNFDFYQYTKYSYTPKLADGNLPKNKMQNFSQVKVQSDLTIMGQERWRLGTNLGYVYTDLTSTQSGISNYEGEFHYFFSSFNFSYFSQLFNKPIIYTSSLILDGSNKHLEKLKGFLSANLILKAEPETKMMVGLVGIIDPSTRIPVIPTFSYEHLFDNDWSIDLLIPQRILLKKHTSVRGRLSLGTELSSTTFYIYDLPHNPGKYEFRKTDLNTGITYEYLLGNGIFLTARTGMQNGLNNRISKKNKSYNNYLVKLEANPAFYFNVGISLNPFFIKTKNQE